MLEKFFIIFHHYRMTLSLWDLIILQVGDYFQAKMDLSIRIPRMELNNQKRIYS